MDTKIIDDANNVHIYLGLGLCLRVVVEGIIVALLDGEMMREVLSGLGVSAGSQKRATTGMKGER